MRIAVLALGLLAAGSLCAQKKRFSWQDYCFNHPAAPFCAGHDYAIKHPAKGKDAAPGNAVEDSFPPAPWNISPSLIGAGGIDWRFADPSADAVATLNFKALAASPLARGLIARLGAGQGLTEVDIQKIFEGLAGADQIALSVRGGRIVAMLTGRIAESDLPALELGLKSAPVSPNAILVGHSDAVDRALQRLAIPGPQPATTPPAAEPPADNEFFAAGSPALFGSHAASAGATRFSASLSIRDRLTSDVMFEFDATPTGPTIATLMQNTPGDATLEGSVLHFRMSVEAGETQQKFGQIAATSLGQRLAALVKAAGYLQAPGASAPGKPKPIMIYGLDGGPKVVKQAPVR